VLVGQHAQHRQLLLPGPPPAPAPPAGPPAYAEPERRWEGAPKVQRPPEDEHERRRRAAPGRHWCLTTPVVVAKLAGYLARAKDPPPGNVVVWRGLTRLMDIHLGFEWSRRVVGHCQPRRTGTAPPRRGKSLDVEDSAVLSTWSRLLMNFWVAAVACNRGWRSRHQDVDSDTPRR
jgi:hypothetical protein